MSILELYKLLEKNSELNLKKDLKGLLMLITERESNVSIASNLLKDPFWHGQI
jgi:hypothetical protein